MATPDDARVSTAIRAHVHARTILRAAAQAVGRKLFVNLTVVAVLGAAYMVTMALADWPPNSVPSGPTTGVASSP